MAAKLDYRVFKCIVIVGWILNWDKSTISTAMKLKSQLNVLVTFIEKNHQQPTMNSNKRNII